jgi:virulence-associated protein VapD
VFAIAFDLTVKEVTTRHPKSVAAAYADIGATLAGFGFRWVQGISMFVKMRIWPISWMLSSVRDVRAFRVEQWSNFTDRVKRRGIKK